MPHIVYNKKNIFYIAIGIIILFLIWEIASLIINEPILILPSPIDSFKEFFRLLTIKRTYLHILATMKKLAIGFLISFLFALVIGLFAGYFERFELIMIPIVTALKAIPTASVLFVFLVVAGFDNAPIYVVILISFPVLYDSVLNGIKNVDTSIIDALKLEQVSIYKKAILVRLPLAIKYILVGVASSFGVAYKVEIMAEVLSGSTGLGIGVAIKTAQITDISMIPIFGYTIIAVLILFIITLISRGIKKILVN